MNEIRIRPAEERDIPQVTAIYNHYVLHSTATYAEEPVSEEYMTAKYRHLKGTLPFFVAEDGDGSISGFAYADRFRPQSAWKLWETTIYMKPGTNGRGVGTLLYGQLIAFARQSPDVIGLTAIVSLDNQASIRFHEKSGFELVGKWENCARKFGRLTGSGSWLFRL